MVKAAEFIERASLLLLVVSVTPRHRDRPARRRRSSVGSGRRPTGPRGVPVSALHVHHP